MELVNYLVNIDLNKSDNVLYEANHSFLDIAIKNLLSLYDIPNEENSEEKSYFFLNDNFEIITEIPKNIYKLLPLTGHEIITPDEELIEILNKSLRLLGNNSSWLSLKKYLGGICFLHVKSKSQNAEVEITSLSIPTFPFISFMSKKATFHTPPMNINSISSIYLAENLLHEATHQALNLNLIEKGILNENYSSETSPLIDIPWRKNQSIERNKKWQIDRVLHAICVYIVISNFRREMLKMGASEYVFDNFKESINNAHYLMNQVKKYKKIFNASAILDILESDIKEMKDQI